MKSIRDISNLDHSCHVKNIVACAAHVNKTRGSPVSPIALLNPLGENASTGGGRECVDTGCQLRGRTQDTEIPT